MSLIYGITKIIPRNKERLANFPDLAFHEFMAAYRELRRAYPEGDLHLKLYVEETSEMRKAQEERWPHLERWIFNLDDLPPGVEKALRDAARGVRTLHDTRDGVYAKVPLEQMYHILVFPAGFTLMKEKV